MHIILRDKDGLEIDRRPIRTGQRSSQVLLEWMKDNPDLFNRDYFVVEHYPSGGAAAMNFISREAVLAILADNGGQTWAVFMRAEIERLPSFPAPNPDWVHGPADRNVMGQSEEQFWNEVDRK